MEGVKGGVERSDAKSMLQFLDQVSEVRENEASRHFAISLYGELAKVHKQAIIPYIPRMMASIVRSLPFSADSHQLHEACAKAVASVARYTIDPTRPYDSNQQVMFNLCSPLLPALSSKLKSSAAGAAICLQALVESEKWKYAHPDLEGLICSKATAALSERGVHTVTFLHLVKSLAKFSRDASHCHVAEWVRVGLKGLQADSGLPGSWQQRIVAAQVIAVILKTSDVDELGLDLRATTKILEAYLMDKVTIVQTAVAEALETIKAVALEKRMHHDLADSGCESKRRNSDIEESGVQDLSGSMSPGSDTSSHEAVPSMASSKLKFGMWPKGLNKHTRDALRLRSHASLNLSRPSKHKENTPATIPRRVLSEIPASGKLLGNSEVLPSSCPPKSLSRSSADLGIKVGNSLMQDKGLLGSEKSIQSVHNEILDCAKKTSSPGRKHIEGCQNFSNMGCTCTLNKEEDGSANQLASIDQLTGKADPDILEGHDDCMEECMRRLPINSSCRCCLNDDCAAGVLTSGCTGDILSGVDASKATLTESSTAVETGCHLQGATHNKEEDGSANQLASTDQLTGKADSEILEEHDDCMEEDMHRLPINSSCRRCCLNDDYATGVLTSGCTGDIISVVDAGKAALSESLSAVEMGSHLQVEKHNAITEDFTFRAPCSLLHSLQSSTSTNSTGKSYKKCTDSDSYLLKKASQMGSDDLASGETEESHGAASDYVSRDETSGASSCTLEDANSSGDRIFKSELHTHRQSFQTINDLDGECLSGKLNNCEIHASGSAWSSSRDTSDSGFGADTKIENRQNGKLQRSSKRSGPRKHLTAKVKGHTKFSARPDCKFRGVDHSGKEFIISEIFKKQICAGTFLGLVCVVVILVLAVMISQHVNQIFDSHALVPT